MIWKIAHASDVLLTCIHNIFVGDIVKYNNKWSKNWADINVGKINTVSLPLSTS